MRFDKNLLDSMKQGLPFQFGQINDSSEANNQIDLININNETQRKFKDVLRGGNLKKAKEKNLDFQDKNIISNGIQF